MSELKIRGAERRPWETIPTDRAKVKKTRPWKWTAHQGYESGNYANSVPAMIRANEKGFDACECDVRFTSDGVAILCHDPAISGTNESGERVTMTIAESTAAEITELTLSTVPRFGKIHPATLDKFLDTARIIGIDVILDLKDTLTEEQAKSVACSVLAHGMQRRATYMPYQLAAAEWIAEVDRCATIEFVNGGIPSDLSSYVALLASCEYVGFELNATSMPDADSIATLRANGLGLSFWNVTSSNYAACLDYRPRAMTLAKNTDIDSGWDEAYLSVVELW